MESIKLSNKYTIYKGVYNEEYQIEEFLKLVKFNHNNVIHTNDNSAWIEIKSPVFDSINNQIKFSIEEISGKKLIHFAEHQWVYTQRKGFNLEWMHQHLEVHPPGRSKIKTDFTFTFYLQTTDEISGDEGKIVFQTEDGIQHKFLPEVGDIFIFPADIRHTAIPTPNSNKERIVYAGNYCIDIFNQSNFGKKIV
jgi:predicted 2-oxoglutarate/Fe(II)-dependent dioxygenase YbiX